MAITSEYTAGSAIKITKLNKWFGDFHVLKDIDLSIDNGERVVICGLRLWKIDTHSVCKRSGKSQ